MIEILYEDNHLLVVVKPCNMPVQEDESKDIDVCTTLKQYLKETYHKPGNVYCGLVHRLDRPVGGVMVFAKTSKAASRLSETIRKNEMKKTYLAVIEGVPSVKEGAYEDYLVKDSKTNMVTVCSKDQGKKCLLHYQVVNTIGKQSLVRIQLDTGRSHQIRVQFASRGTPLVHDQRYNPHPTKGQIALWSYCLEFPHPTTKEMMTFTSLPGNGSPWNTFKENL